MNPETIASATAAKPKKTRRQPGIEARPADHLLATSWTLTGTDPAAVRATIESLRELLRKELRSDLDEVTPASSKDQPSAETGELGFSDHYERYRLDVMVGFGASAYDK